MSIYYNSAVEPGTKFGVAAVNSILSLFFSETPPSNPFTSMCWLDGTQGPPYKMKMWNGTSWVEILTMTADEILTAIKTVDGHGSGLDADSLDGWGGTYYLDASNLTGIISLDRLPGTLTGKSADQLDGQEGSFYRDASNLNAGSVNRSRLGALWEDGGGQNTNPFITSGEDSFTGAAIYFPKVYDIAPRVFTSTPSNSSHAVPHVWGVTTTHFYGKAKTMDTQAVVSLPAVMWGAVGKRS